MNYAIAGWSKTRQWAVAASLALGSLAASAGPAITSFSGGTNFPAFNGTNQTIGWSFTVAAGSGVTVNQLGWWDATPATDLSASHEVGIWDLTGLLLGSAVVQTDGALADGFRYASTTPFALAGGARYVIGGSITSPFADLYVSGVSSLDMDPAIIFGGSARSLSSSGFAFPATLDGVRGRFGPNFDFTVNGVQSVPEPSSLSVVLLGLGLLGAARLRRKKTAVA